MECPAGHRVNKQITYFKSNFIGRNTCATLVNKRSDAHGRFMEGSSVSTREAISLTRSRSLTVKPAKSYFVQDRSNRLMKETTKTIDRGAKAAVGQVPTWLALF